MKIFISRKLEADSPLIATAKNHSIHDESLINFSPIAFEEPEADWIFFYSRNGVKYFFEQGNYELYPYKWACMSQGTAEELSQYVIDNVFIGDGQPHDVARQFSIERQDHETTCFVRANHSLDSVNVQLAHKNDFSIPVYDNISKTEITKEDFDILVFTSPMNVNAWFSERKNQDEVYIAIGQTTKKALLEKGVDNILIPEKPLEKSIAILLQNVIDSLL